MNVDISCIGNHEFDHGEAIAKKLINKTNSPWILSNLIQKESNKPICDVEPYHIIET
jgi:5'-nucleotidase